MLARDKESLQEAFVNHLEFSLAKDRYSATQLDFLKSIVYTIRDRLFERWIETQQTYYNKDVKRVYYISMEFMMGRMLGNAITSLDLDHAVYDALWELGLDLEELEELECDFGLGNGGLGRLAACFLDSMATLELPAYGYGIRYEYGIFSQKIQDGYQIEAPDNWLRFGNPWEIERPEYCYPVKFYGSVKQYYDEKDNIKFEWINTDDVIAMAFDVPIPGYKNNTVNNLRLWSAKASEEFHLDYFNYGDYDKAVQDKVESEVISKVLYPRDDFLQGRELRLKQEYFLSSATLQDIVRRFKKSYTNFKIFPEKVAIQLNDTHPVLCIPELMHILLDKEGLPWERAWDITVKSFGYTNHTILQEALESWRLSLIEKVLPRHLQIIYEINHRFLNQIRINFPDDPDRLARMSIIEEGQEKKIRMANLAIIGSHSINGVAQLHTEIIKEHVFRDYAQYWPEKFNCKTNGITQRRWLKQSNPRLAKLLSETIGDKWILDLYALKELEKHSSNPDFLTKWGRVKYANKKDLTQYIQDKFQIEINPDSVFDCQIKRIHEYKRQLLNILHVITIYNRIKSGSIKNPLPRTVIFAGKAAPAYLMAKLIIKLINTVAKKINKDEDVAPYLKVIFIPDYSVSLAQIIIPAADLSQQISTAGMEASGTGNMKFALNGALTIGTLDGANIEIKDAVGADNIFIFGLTAQEVKDKREQGYQPKIVYDSNPELKMTVDMIAEGYFSDRDKDLFKPITDTLLNGDYYMILADFDDYLEAQENVNLMFKKKDEWNRRSIINTANMGRFSSDRTIIEYVNEIWKIIRVPIKLAKGKGTDISAL
ncbi:MAG: maltodextrin phosphorylase [Bacteroides sp. SM23_62]|nr:MAG: maltodextrin phosphorylase [Bacteroides sp. SM23_62]